MWRWRAGRGVCQDFAHIMITLVRSKLKMPCRYVSGYLAHRGEDSDRSAAAATHAWIEVLMPHFGWVGFDPTNWLVAGERHIRTAIGRDYADVPPTHGLFRGRATSELDGSGASDAERRNAVARPGDAGAGGLVDPGGEGADAAGGAARLDAAAANGSAAVAMRFCW